LLHIGFSLTVMFNILNSSIIKRKSFQTIQSNFLNNDSLNSSII